VNRQQIGPLDVVTLTSREATALTGWLQHNGFAAKPTLATAAQPYIDDGWAFIAVRLRPGGSGHVLSGRLDPLQIHFATDQPVYPMRLSAMAAEPERRTTWPGTTKASHHGPHDSLDTSRRSLASQRLSGRLWYLVVDVFADLAAEQDRLEELLAELSPADWAMPSAAPGWTISDVVLHLAQTEEAVVASATGTSLREIGEGATLDERMDFLVRRERTDAAVVFERWRTARRAALTTLRDADPHQLMPWATNGLKPRTLATTRLAEHWAHGLDIATPLGIPFPDTDRLRHIAWLGHATLPFAFALAGQAAHEVRCELAAPGGGLWTFGPDDAASKISGAAGAFCRVAAQRLAPQDSGLRTSGPHGSAALSVLRTYAV
jgi:uncharacterized protein (TIGR03084 family)